MHALMLGRMWSAGPLSHQGGLLGISIHVDIITSYKSCTSKSIVNKFDIIISQAINDESQELYLFNHPTLLRFA